jgi:hypothetical protein
LETLLLFDDTELPAVTPTPAAIYCDGGTMGKSPSPMGGTWAWVLTNVHGQEIEQDSGVVFPSDVGLPAITNNISEMWAAYQALKSLPEGWRGQLWTDSYVTYARLAPRPKPPQWDGTPNWLRCEVRKEQERIEDSGKGFIRYRLLLGHPTPQELALGSKRTEGGVTFPVSEHNVTCDKLCSAAGYEHLRSCPNKKALCI